MITRFGIIDSIPKSYFSFDQYFIHSEKFHSLQLFLVDAIDMFEFIE